MLYYFRDTEIYVSGQHSENLYMTCTMLKSTDQSACKLWILYIWHLRAHTSPPPPPQHAVGNGNVVINEGFNSLKPSSYLVLSQSCYCTYDNSGSKSQQNHTNKYRVNINFSKIITDFTQKLDEVLTLTQQRIFCSTKTNGFRTSRTISNFLEYHLTRKRMSWN